MSTPTHIEAHFTVGGRPEFTGHMGTAFHVTHVKWSAFSHPGIVINELRAFGETADGTKTNDEVWIDYNPRPLPAWAPDMPDWYARVVAQMRADAKAAS